MVAVAGIDHLPSSKQHAMTPLTTTVELCFLWQSSKLNRAEKETERVAEKCPFRLAHAIRRSENLHNRWQNLIYRIRALIKTQRSAYLNCEACYVPWKKKQDKGRDEKQLELTSVLVSSSQIHLLRARKVLPLPLPKKLSFIVYQVGTFASAEKKAN